MKLPWKKRVRVSMNREQLENMIKDLLSPPCWQWRYRSLFQEFKIDLGIDAHDAETLRKEIYDWLGRRQ